MKQVKWFERKFNFQEKQNIFPAIMERLIGTPVRLEEKLSGLPDSLLSCTSDGTWTIKENIGHLSDLEPLWQQRLSDILSHKTELCSADLQNSKTFEAKHNTRSLQELLSEFREIRQITMTKLFTLDEDAVFKSAIHPRLKIPMRTIDLFHFVAEHDDHHLARITELIIKK